MPHKAIFLDRDGVINADKDYVSKPEDIVFVDGVFDFCRQAQEAGYMLIVITNQSGIGRGLFSEEDFEGLMYWMQEQFTLEDCPLTDWYFCPHHPTEGKGDYKKECDCRKPRPGMILSAAGDWEIDLPHSILIGDKESDIEAGKAAGVGRVELFKGKWPEL